MTKPEKLIVPKDLGDWLDTRDIGNESLMFILIDGLREQVEEEFSGKTREFVFDYKKQIIEVLIGNREYEVEEPLLYAFIKGKDLLFDYKDDQTQWVLFNRGSDTEHLGLSQPDEYVPLTKSKWAKYGIDDSNAEFVEVKP